jgi:hypothetical protein
LRRFSRARGSIRFEISASSIERAKKKGAKSGPFSRKRSRKVGRRRPILIKFLPKLGKLNPQKKRFKDSAIGLLLEENDQDGNFRCQNNIAVVLQLLDTKVVSNRHVRPHCRPFETII